MTASFTHEGIMQIQLIKFVSMDVDIDCLIFIPLHSIGVGSHMGQNSAYNTHVMVQSTDTRDCVLVSVHGTGSL